MADARHRGDRLRRAVRRLYLCRLHHDGGDARFAGTDAGGARGVRPRHDGGQSRRGLGGGPGADADGGGPAGVERPVARHLSVRGRQFLDAVARRVPDRPWRRPRHALLQTRLMDVAGEAQTLAAALHHSAFNVANALGPWLGGARHRGGLWLDLDRLGRQPPGAGRACDPRLVGARRKGFAPGRSCLLKGGAMLRLTELKLPLGHPAEALPAAICERLGLAREDLLDFTVARRANDARRKSAILMVYSVDVALKDEAAVLARFKGDHHLSRRPTPAIDPWPGRPRIAQARARS